MSSSDGSTVIRTRRSGLPSRAATVVSRCLRIASAWRSASSRVSVSPSPGGSHSKETGFLLPLSVDHRFAAIQSRVAIRRPLESMTSTLSNCALPASMQPGFPHRNRSSLSDRRPLPRFVVQNRSVNSTACSRLGPSRTKSTSWPGLTVAASRNPASVVLSRIPRKNDSDHTWKSRWSSPVAA